VFLLALVIAFHTATGRLGRKCQDLTNLIALLFQLKTFCQKNLYNCLFETNKDILREKESDKHLIIHVYYLIK